MNHDYAHCLNYTKDCPKDCFRAELQRDIEEHRSEFVGVPLTYAHFRNTVECKLVKDKDVTCKMSLEPRPIDYQDCSNAMLKMWLDNVVTDGEYNRIMEKLNTHWGKKNG